MDVNHVKRLISSALGSVRQALRGKVVRAKAGKRVPLLQVEGLRDEAFNDIELFQQPGLRSVPLAGMQPIIIPLNGSSANGVVVAMSNGALFVVDLQPGEVAIFNESDGVANSVILRNGRIMDIQCDTLNIVATQGVKITTPAVTLSDDLNMGGTLVADGDVLAGEISLTNHLTTGVVPGNGLSKKPQ